MKKILNIKFFNFRKKNKFVFSNSNLNKVVTYAFKNNYAEF